MIKLMINFQKINSPSLVVAVSGGVDSCVLLDLLVKNYDGEIIVAHFNHQIRGVESDQDAEFVRDLAKNKYQLKYEIINGGLGAAASEQAARQARYEFLRQLAAKYAAPIVTAHHLDDVVESIAINLTRGTGWRGLAVMQAEGVIRPLIGCLKTELLDYALANNLTWREDATNQDTKFLRNKIRQKITANLDDQRKQLVFDLWKQQVGLKGQIDQLVAEFLLEDKLNRYFMIMIDQLSAIEIIRAWVEKKANYRPTIPQAERIWWQLKTAHSGNVFELNKTAKIKFYLKYAVVISK